MYRSVLIALLCVVAGCALHDTKMVGPAEPATEPDSAATATDVAAALAPLPLPAGVVVLDDFDGEFAWKLEREWGDAAEVESMAWKGQAKNRAMDIHFKLGERKKIVVSRELKPAVDCSKKNAVLVDVNSKLTVAMMMAVGLGAGERYVESAPVVVPPGANKDVTFRLDGKFKSAETDWKYTGKAGDLTKVGKVYLLLYPIPNGRVQIENLRVGNVK